jgi:SAM-dependent methyltransferase
MSGIFDAYARYYDLLYADKDYAGEAAYVLDLAREYLQPPAATKPLQILELGCGTGAHAEHFIATGCTVHGVDRSREMVARASDRLRGNAAASFGNGDATTIDLGRQFDLVVALFHVLSYQTEDAAVAAFFHTAAVHLRPGGVAVFDFWHGPGVDADPPATRVRRLSDTSLNVVRIAEPTQHPETNVIDVGYTLFFNVAGADAWRCTEETHRMRYFFLPELTRLQERAGLESVCYHPWMEPAGEPGPSNWYAVLVGRKPLG